ncbi:hypothetical protein AB0K80_30565 [Streptomyces sp. NPDC052682]
MGELAAVGGVQLHGVEPGDRAVGIEHRMPGAGEGAGLDRKYAQRR